MVEEITLKLKMIWLYGWSGRHEWLRDVWQKEWAERMCCSGHECCCRGADYASWWEYLWKTRTERQKGGDA